MKNINKSLPSINHGTKGLQYVVIQGHSLEVTQSSTFSNERKKFFQVLKISTANIEHIFNEITLEPVVHLIEVSEMMVKMLTCRCQIFWDRVCHVKSFDSVVFPSR